MHSQNFTLDLVRFDAHEIALQCIDGVLVLECSDGTRYENVSMLQAYPLTAPETSVFFCDSEGNELGHIDTILDLDTDSASIAQDALRAAYFVTTIHAIKNVEARHGVTTWTVETSRGPRVIHVKDRNDIRKIPGGKIVITDVHGMKYQIDNVRTLDIKSQMLVETET